MGTKVHCESLFTGYHHHSMRDLNNESNGCRWPSSLLYGETSTSANDQSRNGLYDKDVVRKTMLEHEATFKAQVSELHRVYRIQKDMMDELKRKHSSSQATTNDDFRRWKIPLTNDMSVVEDNGHSPMKGSNSQPAPWQNGASSKLLEARPSKMRKKMIDLCLPAEEYVDDDDDHDNIVELKDDRRVCGGGASSSQVPNGSRGDGLRIGYELSRRSNGLADLNEPPKAQEANEFSYGHLRDYGKALNSSSVRENGKPNVWPNHPLRTDHYTGAHKSVSPFIHMAKQLDSSSHPKQVTMNNGSQRVMGLHCSSGPPRRTFIDLEADTVETNESSSASHQPQQRPLYPSYKPLDSTLPWSHLHPSWQNPTFGFPQNIASTQRYPLSVNAQGQVCIGDRLQFESNSRIHSGFGNSMFFNECSSSSKPKLPVTGYNYPNGVRSDRIQANPFVDSNGSETKFVRDLNLNVTPSNTCVVEARKGEEESMATLPWLTKPKSACADESRNKGQNLMWLERLKPESEKIDATLRSSGFGDSDRSDAGRDNVRMMLDINEPLPDEYQQTEEQNRTEFPASDRCQIDLNMSVNEDEGEDWPLPPSSRLNAKARMIDLEAPAVPESDDEVSLPKPSGETLEEPPEVEKIAAETILAISSAEVVEAPETITLHWFAETVDTHRENLDGKLASFSRNQARSLEEIDYFESMTLQLPEMTEDEYMPTPLVPEHLRFEEASGTATVATSQRPRRGNARKGKQRRDFQRDILPGMVPLSKHEVTEDIHMFDGFMRAAGKSWTPRGLTRKKTGTRGRPRRVVITVPEPAVYCPVQAAPTPSVQRHVSSGEVEDRSFAGWGKMTRRPRRQRCPSAASNQRCSSSSHAPLT